ncbi:MAG: hypothetical protein KC731_05895, partial [Myxococcales bacterium]|nr:hypothetical protein [Myxococcales bacterium]
MEATKAQPTAAPDPGARLVELIERSAAESVRRLVLDRALRGSGLDHPPTGAEDLADFLAGPLYDAARDVLDEEFAQALLLAVAPFLDPRHPDLVDDDGPPSRPASDRGYPFASTFLPPTVPRTVPRTDEPMRAQSAVQPRYEPL